MSARARILGLVITAGLILGIALVPVGRRNHRQIVAVAISKDGSIAAGTSSGRVAIWDALSQTTRETSLPKNAPLNDLQFSPDGQYLAVGGADLAILSKADLAARMIRKDRRNYGTVRFSQDGANILTITGAATIELIDVSSGATTTSICCSTIYGEVAFAPDYMSIVSGGHWPRLWSLGGGRTANLAMEREIETIRPIVFAEPDRVLMGSQDGRVYVWSLETHKLLTRSPAQPGYVDTIAALKGGWIAYAHWGGVLRMWNMDTGEQRILQSAFPTSNVITAPDKHSVLFGTSSGTVEFRSIENGELLREVDLK